MTNELEKIGFFMIGQKAALIRNGKCLIVEMANHPGLWELPGGRINEGESKEVALRREIKEELGLKKFEILGLVDYEVWSSKDTGIPFCATVNLIKNESDEIILSDESLQYRWITKEEVDDYKYFWEVAPRFIKNSFRLYNLLNEAK